MNSFLLNRQLGAISPEAFKSAHSNRLLQSFQAAENITFALEAPTPIHKVTDTVQLQPGSAKSVAHAAGVNSIAIDRFEGRYLLSGGADSSLAIWDLDADVLDSSDTTHLPLAHIARSSSGQSLGITHVAFYPFDSLAFLTSSYDHTLKLYSSETFAVSATFDLGSVVYSHSSSNVGSSLLVACASQHPAVRLVDLRSGSSTHSLAGHSGAVLTVAWHPKDENLLASGATDGCVRLWDIRRSASSLGVLDMEDSIGIAGYDGKGTGARRRERGKSHNGAVNGITWTEDGGYLVSVGHDERMRVWNMTAGANTLANFGPALKNAHTTTLLPLIAPSGLSPPGRETVYFLNPKEVLSFDLHSGSLLSRLRAPGIAANVGLDASVRNLKNRTTSLAWRAHNIEMYSAHADGTIRCWSPRTWEDAVVDQDEKPESEAAEAVDRKRKRDELDQIVRDLTKKPVTFT